MYFWSPAQNGQDCSFSCASWTDEYAKASRSNLGQCRRFLLSGTLFLLKIFWSNRDFLEVVVKFSAPVDVQLMPFGPNPFVNRRANKFISLSKSFQLVGTSSVCHRQHVNLAGKLFFFRYSKKIGRYFRPLFMVETLFSPKVGNDGCLGAKRIAIQRCLFQFPYHQSTQTSGINRCSYAGRFRDRKVLSNEVARKHPAIYSA